MAAEPAWGDWPAWMRLPDAEKQRRADEHSIKYQARVKQRQQLREANLRRAEAQKQKERLQQQQQQRRRQEEEEEELAAQASEAQAAAEVAAAHRLREENVSRSRKKGFFTRLITIFLCCGTAANACIMPPTQLTLAGLQLCSTSPPSASITGYESLLSTIRSLPVADMTDDLNAYIDHFLAGHLGLVHSRPLLDSFANTLASLAGPSANDVKIEAGEHALLVIQAQASSFDEQNARIREIIASAYEERDEYDAAAKVLAGINVSKWPNEQSVALWIRITRSLLEIDNTTDAESWLSKAKNLMYTIEDKDLQLHFAMCQARIQDSRRDFLNAAQGYMAISHNPFVTEEDRLQTLSAAIKCAVLAGAGPARSRMLRRLCQDERSATLEEYGMLDKMYNNRVIHPTEVASFAQGLAAHQLATTADGGTVLDKAVIEHNLLAISKLYNNISFLELGSLLGLSGAKAEDTTARMIEQGRLLGRMDQRDQYIYFEEQEASGELGSRKSEAVVNRELRKYDANVQGLAEMVEQVTSDLQVQYPDFVARNLRL